MKVKYQFWNASRAVRLPIAKAVTDQSQLLDRLIKELTTMTSLQGKVAVVTGGNREIGVAMAEALARAGAAVVIAYHPAPDLAEAAATRIRAAGGQALHGEWSHADDRRRLDDGRARAVGM